MIYYATTSTTISWDEAVRAVITQMRYVVISSEYRQGVEKGLELLIEMNGENWIGDTRYHSPLSPVDQEWIVKDCQPRARAAGLKRMAIIVSENSPAREAVHNVAAHLSIMGVNTAYFYHLDEAKVWLRCLGSPGDTR